MDISAYLKNIPIVYHIGYMDKKDKNKNSYEGSGLSVTTKPESWIIICKLANKPIHKIYVSDSFLDLRKIKKNESIILEAINYCLNTKIIIVDPNTKTGFSGTDLMCSLFFQDHIKQITLIDFCLIYFFVKKYNVYNFFWNYMNKPIKLIAPVGVIYKVGCFN